MDTGKELHGEIAAVAYELYKRRGGVPGHELQDWLQAEQTVMSRKRPAPSLPPGKGEATSPTGRKPERTGQAASSDLQARRTGISGLTGKVVTVRHATKNDEYFIRDMFKRNSLPAAGLKQAQCVVATENESVVGVGVLQKRGDLYKIFSVVVEEEKRKAGIGSLILQHLIEFARADRVYVVTTLPAFFRKAGFFELAEASDAVLKDLGIGGEVIREKAAVLMVHDKGLRCEGEMRTNGMLGS